MQKWRALNAEELRVKQTNATQKRIRSLYRDLLRDVQTQLRTGKVNQDLTKVQLQLLEIDLEAHVKDINQNIQKGIEESIYDVALQTVEDKRKLLAWYGYDEQFVKESYVRVPRNVVDSIANGNIYQDGWSLSERIWGCTEHFNSKLSSLVARGVATGKSSYEIAKDIEKFVNPSAAKASRKIKFQKYQRDANGNVKRDVDGNPLIDRSQGTFVFDLGQVDYNAQRLARTMVAHAYQQAFEVTNALDPFVQDYIWLSAAEHGRTCAVCLDRDGKHFKKDELPLDHPNGLCTFEAYIPYSADEIHKRVERWGNSPYGTDKELDEYAKVIIERYGAEWK